ncbi:hypothetical protein FJY69_07185, partial [candidate division WOR-3 bacterium]|nr:hypothetical protein [candidate division WOR-3 bacterium]
MQQKNFARSGAHLEIPNLLSLQLDSFAEFVQTGIDPAKREPQGLEGVLRETFPLEDVHKNFKLEYVGYTFGEPKYTTDEAMAKGVNYSTPLKVVFRLTKKEFGDGTERVKDIIEQEVFFCELPWMTVNGTFIINGVERVVVSQLHRSPGVYFSREENEFSALLVPLRGAWFELVVDKHNSMVVLLDRKRRISAATFLRAMNFSHEDIVRKLLPVERRKLEPGQMLAQDVTGEGGEIYARTGDFTSEGLLDLLTPKGIVEAEVVVGSPPGADIIAGTLRADRTGSKEEALKRIYYRLRSIAPHSLEVAEQMILGMLFDRKRFDLGAVGRYKLNQRLLTKVPLAETGLLEADVLAIISHLLLFAGDGRLYLLRVPAATTEERDSVLAELKKVNLMPESLHWYERRALLEMTFYDEDRGRQAERSLKESGRKSVGETTRYQADDVDHLSSRRVKRVGELLENQFRAALLQLAQNIRERAAFIDDTQLVPQELVNTRVVANAIMQFFTQSQLCQFMEQTNPLTELTHKRRVSTLGPGGLTKETAGFEVRDVHYSHYGRICPIETPEGPNIGLISTVSTYARVDQYGFLTTPYWRVRDGKVIAGKGR